MVRGRHSRLPDAAVAFAVVAALLLGCGGKDDPGEVVVSGRAIAVTGNPYAPRVDAVGLFLRDSLVASADVREDGTFFIRAPRTDDMKQEQSANGAVGFLVRGWFQGGSGHCENNSSLWVRFENGRWIGVHTRKPAFLVFRGVGMCGKLELPFGLPTD
jgi:hypothetical protein